jgi:hypothetical protein
MVVLRERVELAKSITSSDATRHALFTRASSRRNMARAEW